MCVSVILSALVRQGDLLQTFSVQDGLQRSACCPQKTNPRNILGNAMSDAPQRSMWTQELSYLQEQEAAEKAKHVEYLQGHPELHGLLNGWVAALLREQPKTIYPFLRQHFAEMVDARSGVGPPMLVEGPPPLLLVGARLELPETFGVPVMTTSRPPRRGDGPMSFASTAVMRDDASQGKYYELGDEGTPGELMGTTLEAIARVRAKGQIPFLELSLERALEARKCSYVHPPPRCILVTKDEDLAVQDLVDAVVHIPDTDDPSLLKDHLLRLVTDFYPPPMEEQQQSEPNNNNNDDEATTVTSTSRDTPATR